jgi:hypothetical protein
MGNGGEYRAKAAELLDLAQGASDPELAAIYRQLARQYQRLADWMERSRDLPDAAQPPPE